MTKCPGEGICMTIIIVICAEIVNMMFRLAAQGGKRNPRMLSVGYAAAAQARRRRGAAAYRKHGSIVQSKLMSTELGHIDKVYQIAFVASHKPIARQLPRHLCKTAVDLNRPIALMNLDLAKIAFHIPDATRQHLKHGTALMDSERLLAPRLNLRNGTAERLIQQRRIDGLCQKPCVIGPVYLRANERYADT